MPRRVKKYFLAAAFAVLLTFATVWAMSKGTETIDQPIAFNHAVHTKDLEMECTECHVNVESHAEATLPRIEICMGCHDEDIEEMTPAAIERIARLRKYAEEGEEVPWIRMYDVPVHVIFSHKTHIKAGVNCVECHDGTSTATTPTRVTYTMTMNYCMKCHKQRGASLDCIHCHK